MKTYKNVSPVEQLGIDPGQTGEADIPEDQELRMIQRGAIEVVGDAAPAEESPVSPEDEAKAAEEKAAKEKADAEAKAAAEQRSSGKGGRS